MINFKVDGGAGSIAIGEAYWVENILDGEDSNATPSEIENLHVEIQCEKQTVAKLSLRYLVNIAKAGALSTTVVISMLPLHPVKFYFDVPMGHIEYHLSQKEDE